MRASEHIRCLRRPALRYIAGLSWEERHARRHRVANRSGCRSFAYDWAQRHGLALRIEKEGRRWAFMRGRTREALWRPGEAALHVGEDVVHCHDIFQVVFEIAKRLGTDA